MAIYLGPAGSGGGTERGFAAVKEAGLDALEIEFTYSVWMKPAQAKEIAEANKKLGLKLSIHAPYYINLNSRDKGKIEGSKKRILKCCEMGHLLGVKYVVFHPGFYLGMEPEQAYKNIKKQIQELQSEIKKNRWKVVLAPETTGKRTQFGSLEELKRLKRETGCSICIDFAHLKARVQGKITYDEIAEQLKGLGFIHAHFSGIEYTLKGEKRHLMTSTNEIKELLSALKKHKISCTIINESPNPIGDSLKTKKILKKLR